MTNERGQMLAEFGIAAVLFVGILIAAGKLFTAEWTRWKCSREVFEATRAALVQRPWNSPYRVTVTGGSESDYVKGVARCNNQVDQIRFPTLSKRVRGL